MRPKLMGIRRVFTISKAFSVCAFVAVVSPFLAAQKLPSIEVFGGYSYLRFESTTLGFADRSNLNGWNGAISLPHVYGGLGVAVDISGHYTREMEEYNFLIGPQYSFEWKSARIYGHGLFGRARDRLRQPGTTLFEPSNLGRAIALGGGLDYQLSPKLWLRAVQADYLTTSLFGSTQANIRISTGLIFRFGKR